MSDSTFPQQWTTQGFLDEFMRVHEQLPNRRFCFILGSGASKTSGVLTGAELVDRWLPMHQRKHDPKHASRKIEEWATEKTLKIPKFTYERRAEFYAQVFYATFGHNFETGYGELENLIEHARPSVGYSVLAQILALTRHCVIITTNFDNLVADALAIYTDKLPLICGHEALAGFAQVEPRRPLIVKVHHDLLLNPKNKPEETANLSEGWKCALRALFSRYTPIVLGYGGNDEGFMNFVANDKDCCTPPGNMFWLHRITGGPPKNERIQKVMARHRGIFVPCVGFDEIMSQLRAALAYPLLADEVEKKAKERAREYREQFEAVEKRLKEADPQPGETAAMAEVKKAIGKTIDQEVRKNDWWAWYLKAEQETDLVKREEIYRQGISECPESPELAGDFARFLKNVKKNYDEAERYFRKAVELGPNDSYQNSSYADFLFSVRKKPDQAEWYHRKALELDPNDAFHNTSYAVFLHAARKNDDEAEQHHRKAVELGPDQAIHAGIYAEFLSDVRKNYDEAERYYLRALELAPKDPFCTSIYAGHLSRRRKSYDEAERYYLKALELDPNNAASNGSYASFLLTVRKSYDEAERYYQKALELSPGEAIHAGIYAEFLSAVRKNYDEAERYYLRALELEISNPLHLGRYAFFLCTVRKNYDEAERYLLKALELEPSSASPNGNYGSFLLTVRKNYDEAERYLLKALELDPNNAGANVSYAYFLNTMRKNYDEAERYYQKAVELDPNSARPNGSYALFLHDVRKNYDKAERYYRKALEWEPNDADWTCNYAGFLLERRRFSEAAEMAKRAWSLFASEPRQGTTEAALYHALLAAMQEQDFKRLLGQIKTALQHDYLRVPWSFDGVLAACAPELSLDQQRFFRAVTDAILDESKLPALEAMPEWQQIQPVPLSDPQSPLKPS